MTEILIKVLVIIIVFFIDRKNELIQGEFTPRYILYKDALLRIKKFYHHVKIIISLRNPLERAYSQYNFFKYNKKRNPKITLKAL